MTNITTKKELDEYLINECEYTQSEVDNMDDRDKFDAYLRYEGIINFTDDIIALTKVLKFE